MCKHTEYTFKYSVHGRNISFGLPKSVDLVLTLFAVPQMCWYYTVNYSLTILDLSEVFTCWSIKPAGYLSSSDHSEIR